MAFDVSAFGVYTEQHADDVLVKAVLGAKTIQLIKAKGTIMTGVKSKASLIVLDTDAVIQDGAGCDFTPSGTTKFTDRTIEVGDLKVQEQLCPKELEKTYLQKKMIAGSTYEETIFVKDYTELKLKKVDIALETLVWQADKASGSAATNRFDGFIKLIDSASDEINGNPTGITVATGITQANVIGILKGVRKLIPIEIRAHEDSVIFVGQEVLDLYLDALIALNLFHYKAEDQPIEEVYLYGTRTKVIAVPGLNATNRIFALNIANMYYGTDIEGEESQFDMSYAKEAKKVRFDLVWKSGVQIAFTNEVVSFKLVP